MDGCDTGRLAAVVTGATGGIGQALMEALWRQQRWGAVIGACRDPRRLEPLLERLRAACPGSATRLAAAPLDLATMQGAADGAAALARALQGMRIGALVNNAGTMPVHRLMTSPEGREITYQVNYLATVAFTRALLPLMQEPGGVVVFTSSVTRRLVRAGADPEGRALRARGVLGRFANYGRSKLLLTQAACQMARELQERGIRVNCADPGVVDSGIIHLGYPLVDRLADLLARPLMRTPARGAQAALRAVDSPGTALMCTPRRARPIGRG